MPLSNQTLDCWKNFISKKPFKPADIAAHVLHNWNLCRKNNINPLVFGPVQFLTIPKLQQHLQDNALLLEAAKPTIDIIEISTRFAPAITVLTSKDNVILHVAGDNSALSNDEMGYNLPGCICPDKQRGIRAITFCMLQNKPISLCGPEHYCKAFHSSACYAAPIHNPQGRVIGSIGVSGLNSEYHEHTLALVTSAANAIDSRLRELALKKSQIRLNSFLSTIYDSLPEASLAIDNKGFITHVNAKGLNLLHSKASDIIGKQVTELVSDEHKQIFSTLLNTMQKASCDVHFIHSKEQTPCLCRLHPIESDNGNINGIAITIITRSQLLDITSHIGGNYAVYTFEHIIGNTPAFTECIELAHKVAPTSSRVLLVGESGTGKELFAQAIHNHSLVCNGPFVAISCGAIPRDLIEAELFGYVSGAFTGANKKGALGKFELARDGTLFLDEINSLPLDMQSKLLRAIQEGEILKLGDNKPIKVNTRIIAATNKDLKKAIADNTFREDLYYRLNVVEIVIPPLRERRGDIIKLAQHFISKISQKNNFKAMPIENDFLDQLKLYSWPGNIRELCNVCERAIILSEGKPLNVELLPAMIRKEIPTRNLKNSIDSLDNAFLYLYKKSMTTHNNNISLVAKELGISRSTLYRKIKQFKNNI